MPLCFRTKSHERNDQRDFGSNDNGCRDIRFMTRQTAARIGKRTGFASSLAKISADRLLCVVDDLEILSGLPVT